MTVLAAELDPPDACPQCHPGDVPACIPLASMNLTEGTIAAYVCEVCWTAWATWFDPQWWPVERSIAPAATRTAAA